MKTIELLQAFAKEGELSTEAMQRRLGVDHRTVQRMRARLSDEFGVEFQITRRKPTMWAVKDWGLFDQKRMTGGTE